jgi:exopolyphosphatase/guanosine-5'-triphosphate,3'-diphosphate pyrophosphatase
MKLAVLDLGTNTFHLLIAEQNASELKVIVKINRPVKLGEAITKDNFIIPTAFKRGIDCLREFKEIINQHEVEVIKAVATSGVRSANNGADFIEKAKIETDIEIEVIDGDEEAQYIYEAVKWSGAIQGKSLIMDIGGGSTEFMLCDAEELIWKKSYNIGAARLMQAFFKSDPINQSDQKSLIHHLNNELKALKIICTEFSPSTLIGSAGAFETYAEMISPSLDLTLASTADLSYDSFRSLAKKLIRSSHAEREKMAGLIPLRVDMIVMASILTNYLLDEINLKEIRLSTYDLKMGVLLSLKN